MGIFGKKRPAVLDYTSAVNPPPRMGDPLASLGGYDRNAAMQGQSGFAPMNVGFTPPEQKKPGFFSKGGAWLDVLGAFGDGFGTNGPVYAQSKMQRSRLMQEQQQAEQQRQAERENFIWKSQYERDNPKPSNPYRWESNDGSLLELGPDGQPRVVYKDPTPKVNYQRVDNGDGTYTMVPIVNGQIMTQGIQQPGQAPTAPVGKLRPIGGQPGGNGPFVQ